MNRVIKAEQVNRDTPVMPNEKVRPICEKQDDCPGVCGECCSEPTKDYKPQPYMCPICTGSGIVPSGFYNRVSQHFTSSGGTEPCRACGGIGIVWG